MRIRLWPRVDLQARGALPLIAHRLGGTAYPQPKGLESNQQRHELETAVYPRRRGADQATKPRGMPRHSACRTDTPYPSALRLKAPGFVRETADCFTAPRRFGWGWLGATHMSAAGRPAAYHPRCSWQAGLQDPVPADFLHTPKDAGPPVLLGDSCAFRGTYERKAPHPWRPWTLTRPRFTSYLHGSSILTSVCIRKRF